MKDDYEAPKIKIVDVAVEKGFATSKDKYGDPDESHPGGEIPPVIWG